MWGLLGALVTIYVVLVAICLMETQMSIDKTKKSILTGGSKSIYSVESRHYNV